jgi:hypothetical protein
VTISQSEIVEVIQYPLAAAKALIASSSSTSNPVNTKEKTRFLFLSGALAERNQTKSLWFLEEGRKKQVCIPFFILHCPVQPYYILFRLSIDQNIVRG